MLTRNVVQIPHQVLAYLEAHHVVALGTSSFTGMPHAQTVAYVSDVDGLYFSMSADELTIRNIDANHWASFTIDDYTPDFRKVRELRGVGHAEPVADLDVVSRVVALFAEKVPTLPTAALTNLYSVRPLEVHFVDFEYADGVDVPQESSIVYRADEAGLAALGTDFTTDLAKLTFRPGEVIARQGERSGRFFIIVSGEVEVRREGHGQDVVVTRRSSGQFFGEGAAISGMPLTATYTALSAATVMAVDRIAFQDFLRQTAAADLGQRVSDTIQGLDRDES